MDVASLICSETISRVSSVLNREVKQFGKKYMFDRNEETSWNSDQGAIQWLTMEFPQTVQASQIQIQFQGALQAENSFCKVARKELLSRLLLNSTLKITILSSFPFKAEPLDKLKITFQNSSDFFGRIIVYHLDILGQKL